MKVPFHKCHALGNDFIVIESSRVRVPSSRRAKLVRAICERHTGVGADGVVWLSGSRHADAGMDIYNADGGWAEMSGNGLRIAGLYLYRALARRKSFSIETATGVKQVMIGASKASGRMISGELGSPDFLATNIPMKTRHKHLINQPVKIGPVSLPITSVSIGNPHAVLIVDSFDFDWRTLGEDIESLAIFPNGTNVEFVRVVNDRKIEVRLWERGVGETQSSGTGAAASVATTVMLGMTKRKCTVVSPAGQVEIEWSKTTDCITLTGPVEFVVEGEFSY